MSDRLIRKLERIEGDLRALRVMAVIDGDHERAWHQRFAGSRAGGEWFALTDELAAAIGGV